MIERTLDLRAQALRFWNNPAAPGAVLSIIILAVFARSIGHDFVNCDDPGYVYANPHVRDGLSWGNAQWAFTALNGGISYWHPITWLSHQLDAQCFGLHAGAHHLTSVWWHLANTSVLLALLRQLQIGSRSSFLIAGLFGLHPLHVESVAWIAERKDLLYAFFWLLSLKGYVHFRLSGRWRWWVCAWLVFGCAVMSKPTAMTLPAILIALEVSCVLPRPAANGGANKASFAQCLAFTAPFWLIALACGIGVITAQAGLGALPILAQLPLSDRLDNAVLSYRFYLEQAVVPHGLCVSYVRTSEAPLAAVVVAMIIVLLVSLAAFRARRRAPVVLFGWLWFVLALVPNVGLVQAGAQSMADRYTYVPLIGLLLMLSGALRLFPMSVQAMERVWLAGWVALVACAVLSFRQLEYWRNGVSLFTRAVEVNSDNWVAQLGLGMALVQERRFEEALPHLHHALALPGNQAETEARLGVCLQAQGLSSAARLHWERAFALNPSLRGQFPGALEAGVREKDGSADEDSVKEERALPVPK